MTRFQRDSPPARNSGGRGSTQDLAALWRNAEGSAERVGVAVGALLFVVLVGYPIYLFLNALDWTDWVLLLFSIVFTGLVVLNHPELLVSPPKAPPKPAGVTVSDREWKRLWTQEWELALRRECRRIRSR